MALLDGKRAVVTGAAQGIGFAIARRFVDHGASVVLADIDRDAAERAAADLDGAVPAEGRRGAVGRGCDVTDEAAVEAAVAGCIEGFGGIDIMVNNAGITRDRMMHRMDLDAFQAVLDVHLTGTWLGTRAAGRVMREAGHGAIINLSSISGKVGNAGQTNYSAAKAGIVGLTKAAAKELGPKGVRVNAIAPGLIRTAMTEGMPDDVLAERLAAIPLGRMGEPADVADAAVYLASDLASYVTGVVLEVGGGRGI
jgi:3-oxoacyl-[acyl-carrier protein] reductase